MDEKQREYFKTLLMEEKARIEKSLRSVISDLQDNAQQPISDQIDEAVSLNQTSMALRMKDRERKLLSKVNLALDRIDDNIFGECEGCGEDIGKKRLLVRTVTTLCIICKEKQEKREAHFVSV